MKKFLEQHVDVEVLLYSLKTVSFVGGIIISVIVLAVVIFSLFGVLWGYLISVILLFFVGGTIAVYQTHLTDKKNKWGHWRKSG